MTQGRRGETAYKPTREDIEKAKLYKLCGCCGATIDYRQTTDDVTGKPLCIRCIRVIPAVRSGDLNMADPKVSKAFPPGYNALVSLYLRYGGKVPDNGEYKGVHVRRGPKPGNKRRNLGYEL